MTPISDFCACTKLAHSLSCSTAEQAEVRRVSLCGEPSNNKRIAAPLDVNSTEAVKCWNLEESWRCKSQKKWLERRFKETMTERMRFAASAIVDQWNEFDAQHSIQRPFISPYTSWKTICASYSFAIDLSLRAVTYDQYLDFFGRTLCPAAFDANA